MLHKQCKIIYCSSLVDLNNYNIGINNVTNINKELF